VTTLADAAPTPAPTPAPTQLPRTGGFDGLPVVAGASAALLGAGFYLRRRSQRRDGATEPGADGLAS
jgi:LPXTG-motif cell wall-anchored protein